MLLKWFVKSPGALVKALGAAIGGICLCIEIAINWNNNSGNNGKDRDNHNRRPDQRRNNNYR